MAGSPIDSIYIAMGGIYPSKTPAKSRVKALDAQKST
jgi:hypothetical protein